MKQTAVEWLYNQLNDYDFTDLKNNDYYEFKIPVYVLKEKIEQAKEIEKQQIFEAYETSHISMMTSEQYYNQTYGNEQETDSSGVVG
jgi:hypothetical protein